jgi:hypothetical protein
MKYTGHIFSSTVCIYKGVTFYLITVSDSLIYFDNFTVISSTRTIFLSDDNIRFGNSRNTEVRNIY